MAYTAATLIGRMIDANARTNASTLTPPFLNHRKVRTSPRRGYFDRSTARSVGRAVRSTCRGRYRVRAWQSVTRCAQAAEVGGVDQIDACSAARRAAHLGVARTAVLAMTWARLANTPSRRVRPPRVAEQPPGRRGWVSESERRNDVWRR